MAWIYFRESDCSPWPSILGSSPQPTARSTSMLAACSCRGWPTVDCHAHQFGTTLQLFAPKISPGSGSTSSPADSRAKISALRDLDAAWMASEAGFIVRSSGSLASFDPDTCSWKTSQGSESTPISLSEIWPHAGTTVDGHLWPHATWARHTGASDGGVSQGAAMLPTPTASQYGSSQNGSNSTRPSAGTPSLSSRDAARTLWPTPTVGDSRASARGTTKTGVMHPGESLTDRLRSHVGIGRPLLSPRFVEWLMGAPLGWTDCDAWATASFPVAREKLSRTSQDWPDDEPESDQLDLF